MNPIKKYRFLAGMHARKSLQELRVGQPYEIKQYNDEYFLRTSQGSIIIFPEEMQKYFVPYVDYGFEGDGKYEDPEPLYKKRLVHKNQKDIPSICKDAGTSNYVSPNIISNETDLKDDVEGGKQLAFF